MVGSKPTEKEQYSKMEETIDSLPIDEDTAFDIRPVYHRKVLNEVRSLRSDCSTGPYHIPARGGWEGKERGNQLLKGPGVSPGIF